MNRDDLTKSQRKALHRLTGWGALDLRSIQSDGRGGRDVFVTVGSRFTPKTFHVTARGRVRDLH